MKVIFLAGSLNQGGAEFQLISLAKLFKEQGHDVEVFAITDHDFYLPFINAHNIKYTCLRNDQSKLKRVLLTAKMFKQSKPDLIISFLKIVSIVAIFAKILSFTNAKLIIGERTSLIRPWHDLFYFNFLLFANAVTVNSLPKLKYIRRKFPLLAPKLYFTPNIIDIENFLPTPDIDKQKKHITLGYVGRISPEKNIISLIKAVAKLVKQGHPISLSLYGDNKNKLYHELVKREIVQAGMEEFMILKGPSVDVREAYADIDILCLLSSYEGFSNVLAEALASGIPIIASDIAENRYLVKNGENGILVKSNDVENITNGILKLVYLNKIERTKISKCNRLKAEKIFNKEAIYRQYLKILNHLS